MNNLHPICSFPQPFVSSHSTSRRPPCLSFHQHRLRPSHLPARDPRVAIGSIPRCQSSPVAVPVRTPHSPLQPTSYYPAQTSFCHIDPAYLVHGLEATPTALTEVLALKLQDPRYHKVVQLPHPLLIQRPPPLAYIIPLTSHTVSE